MKLGLPAKTLFVGVMSAGLLSGCVTTGKGPGSLLSASLAATPQGQQLNQYALNKAVSAEVNALEATPAGGAKDWRSGKASQATHDKNSRPLSEQVGGLLNPNWVEWLMGWPIGWTDLKHSATDRCHGVQPQPGECSLVA